MTQLLIDIGDALARTPSNGQKSKLLRVKVPDAILRRIDVVAANLRATKADVLMAIIDEGLKTVASQPLEERAVRSRRRTEPLRAATRRAFWNIEEKAIAAAYRRKPDSADDAYLNAEVWEREVPRRRQRRKAR